MNSKIETRAAVITRAANPKDGGTARTLTARLVPYDEITEIIPGLYERFAPGSVTTDDVPPLLFRDHEKPIGAITAVRDEADGCYIDARISETPLGDETLQLIKDGVLTRVSIGFIIEDSEKNEAPEDQDGQLVTIKRALLREGSIVAFPAYPNAIITEHRKGNPKENQTMSKEDFISRAEHEADNAILTAMIETVAASTPAPAPACEIRSYGEYVQLAARRDETAKRAFDGITSTTGGKQEKPAWLGDIQNQMKTVQPFLSLFKHEMSLPTKGLSVEYGEFGENSFTVGTQASEGAPLPKGAKLTYTTKNVPVETAGGWGELSRQAVERANVNLVDNLYRAAAMAYAAHIEARMRATITPVLASAETAPTVTAKPTDANGWLDAILDLREAYDGEIFPLSGLIVSKTTFKALARLDGKDRALQIEGAPQNKDGVLNVSVPSANLYGLTVAMLPNWDGAHAVGYSASAATCLESPGAPLRLTDEDITNLTNAFSVYGYAAFFVSGPSAFKAINLKA